MMNRAKKNEYNRKYQQQKYQDPTYRNQKRTQSRNYVRRRYAEFREKYYMGVKCSVEGCECEDIHYHHIDPATKLYDPSKMYLKKPLEIEAELAKCIPLCREHHILIHTQQHRLETWMNQS